MQRFPTPPVRRGSTPAGGDTTTETTLPPAIPYISFHGGEGNGDSPASTSRSPSPSPSTSPDRPRRSSKRSKPLEGAVNSAGSSPMSPAWSSSTASTVSSGGATAEEGGDVDSRVRGIQDSLNKLEGTAFAVAREQAPTPAPTPPPPPPEKDPPVASTSKQPWTAPPPVSPVKLPLLNPKKSNGTLGRASSEHLRELARGKRRAGVGTSVSSRASVNTFSSFMSTGESIYEDAVETPSAWTEDEGNDAGSSDESTDTEEGLLKLANGAYPPTVPATPPPLPRTTPTDDPRDFPPRAFSPLARPVFGSAKFDLDQQKRLHNRRASLQAEYQGGPRPNHRASLQLEPSSTMIPLRRFSAIPAGFAPSSPSRRHSTATSSPISAAAFGSPASSAGDHSSSTIVPPTPPPHDNRRSFQLKPLVLTPQRTLNAPLTSSPTSVGSPGVRRRLSDQFVGSGIARHGSLNAGRPMSSMGSYGARPVSPLSFGGALVDQGPSRRRSMGYIETSKVARRDSSSTTGSVHGPPSAWSGERRMRSASEDTGYTKGTGESLFFSASVEGPSGAGNEQSPDSSMSSWSEEKEKESQRLGSPALSEREWEQEYHRRSATPLGVLEEGRQVEQWEEDGTARKRRTLFEEEEDEEDEAENRRLREADQQMAAYPLTPAAVKAPLIELSEPSPTGAQHTREEGTPREESATTPRANGMTSPAGPLDEDNHFHPPSPPPVEPLPVLPMKEGVAARRASTKSAKPRKSARKPVKYDEHWNGESFVDSSPATTYSPFDSPIVNEETTSNSAAGASLAAAASAQPGRPRSLSPRSTLFASALSTPADEEPPSIIPDFKSIQIKSSSNTPRGSSAGSSINTTVTPRKGLRLERTDVSPVSHQNEFLGAAPHELSHAKSFSHQPQQKRRGSGGLGNGTTRSSSELRTGVRELAGLAIWPPPDTQTKKVSAGPRISTPGAGGESEEDSPPSPILYYREDDARHQPAGRRDSYSRKRESAYGYLPRRPNLEPRDPRAHIEGPDSYLEVLLNEEPPLIVPAHGMRRNTFDSGVASSESLTRWSEFSASTTATSQMSEHIPGQESTMAGRRNSLSPSSSPTKGTFTKRIFGSFSKDKKKQPRPESTASALSASLGRRSSAGIIGLKQPISIPAGGTSSAKAPRPISIPARPLGAPPATLPRSSLSSQRSRPNSTISNGFIPRPKPVSPLFPSSAHMERNASSSSKEELSDFDPRRSPPQSRRPSARGYQPRKGPVNDDVKEELVDWNLSRASMESAASELPRAALSPKAYQLPPGLGGPPPASITSPSMASRSRSNSQHRRKRQGSGSGASSGGVASPPLPFGATNSFYGMPTSSAVSQASYGSRSRQGSIEAPAMNLNLAARRPSAQSLGAVAVAAAEGRRGSQPYSSGGEGTSPNTLGVEFDGARRGSADSQGAAKKKGLPFGVRDVFRAQVGDR